MKLPLATLLMGAILLSAPGPAAAQRTFAEKDLISDVPGRADSTDANLLNPWGLVPGPTGVFWSSNNHSGTSTLYRPDGTRVPLVVNIPDLGNTGIAVTNAADSAFVIPSGDSTARAIFIFVTEAGSITAWNNTVNLTNAITVARIGNANYKGVALARSVAGPRLYATNFGPTGSVDVFDRYFRRVSLPASRFQDPELPAGYAPFNVATIGNRIFVAYALFDTATGEEAKGAGLGLIDVFDKTGHFLRRFASSGVLNAPWGMVLAPGGFGDFGGALLVGNFGDGRINAFDVADGTFLGALQDTLGNPISIEGLWGLSFGLSVSGPDVANRLYFAAGIEDEVHGLFGYLAPARSSVAVECQNDARSLSFWRGQCAGPRRDDDDDDDDDRRGPGRGVPADSLQALLGCISSSSHAFGSSGCFTASCDLLSKHDAGARESAAKQFLALLLDRCAGVVCDSAVVSCRDRDDDDRAAPVDSRRDRSFGTVGEIIALLDSSLCQAQGRDSYEHLEALASCAIRSGKPSSDRSNDDDRAAPAAPGDMRAKLKVQALGGNPVRSLSGLGARFVISSSAPAVVRFGVYDAAGRLVAEPLHDVPVTGQIVVHWDGRTLHGAPAPSGTYFYRAIAGDAVASGRVVIMR